MHPVPLTCRRPGQAATEQRSTSEVIVPPVLLFPVGPGSHLLPEIGSGAERDPNYELLNTFSAWRANCIFIVASRVDLPKIDGKATGVASWFSSMPRRDAGRFYPHTSMGSILCEHPAQMLYHSRKCLTDFPLGFMMVSSLRKEVVQSNMGICSDCRFIITREVADS
jgi:hypothetical protein